MISEKLFYVAVFEQYKNHEYCSRSIKLKVQQNFPILKNLLA